MDFWYNWQSVKLIFRWNIRSQSILPRLIWSFHN